MPKADDSPAWMLCEELMVKVKEAMVSEAIRVLHEEIDSGRIKLNAGWVNTESQTEELERAMFLINRLVEEAPKMLEAQSKYIAAAEAQDAKADAKTIENIESMKRLGMAVSYISALIGHVGVIDGWIKGIGNVPHINDMESVLKETLNEERLNTVKFIIATKALSRDLLSEDEARLLKDLEK